MRARNEGAPAMTARLEAEAADRRDAGLPAADEDVIEPEPIEVLSAAGDGSLEDLDRSDRIGRTALQVGTPAAIVGIGSWLARLNGVDLDPGAGIDLPADVAGYFVAVITVALAWRMNPKTKL